MLTKKETRERLIAAEDPKLLPEEKEAHFHISEQDKSKVKFSCNIKEIMQHLLDCEELEISQKRTYYDEQGRVIHLEGTLPVTVLRIHQKPKTSNYLSEL